VSTLQDLTISSSNCGFLRLDEAVGTANTRRTVEAMAGRLDPDVDGDPLPMQVDNPRLTALDEAVMAGTLARGGFAPFPHLVTSFVDGNDGPRFFTAVSSVRSVRADAAAETIAVLAANVRDGTAQAAAGIEGAEAWAKTGTAVDFHTAWFMGGAGEYTAAVWTGWPDGRLMENVFGLDYVTGDSVPGNIWTDVMTAALASE
jgi:penicillin-binding protein 1A